MVRGYPLEPEIDEGLERGLINVKNYLEDHLDPNTESRRMGIYGPEEPGDQSQEPGGHS
jgi:hypothetical protein